MNRRLLLVIVLVVVIVGAAAALLLVSQGSTPAPATQPAQGNQVAQQRPTEGPRETPIPTPTPIPFISIVVAIQDIPRGIRITPDAVTLRPVPEQSAPFQAFTSVEEVIGLIARTDIYREQPVLTNLLVQDFAGLAQVGSDVAAILPPTRVAVAVPMDRLTSVAYAIQPGDRVDVMVSMLFIDVDVETQTELPVSRSFLITSEEDDSVFSFSAPIRGEFGSENIPSLGTVATLILPSEDPRPRLTTQRTIQDAQVIWTGNFPVNGRIFRPAPTVTPTPDPAEERENNNNNQNNEPQPTPVPPRPDIITLAVSPQDAVVLTWMVEAGLPMTFALRSAASTSQVTTDPVTLDYIMNRYRIDVPEKFEYNIEPAIRSIRELSVGNRISLRAGG